MKRIFSITLVLVLVFSVQQVLFAADSVKLEFRIAQEKEEKGFTKMSNAEGKDIFVSEVVELTNADLVSAKADQTMEKSPFIAIELQKESAAKFEVLTEKQIGKMLAIVIDGKVISAPVIRSKIAGGKVQITGKFTMDEAATLAKNLAPAVKGSENPAPAAALSTESSTFPSSQPLQPMEVPTAPTKPKDHPGH